MTARIRGVHSALMDSTAPSQSILDTLRTVEFRLGLKGYNVDEVDEYLEKAAVEAEAVQEQLRVANDRLRQANERIEQLEERGATGEGEPAPVSDAAPPDDTLQRTLILAQKFVDQTKREAEEEAAGIVSRAEERSRSVVSQAEDRARQLTTEAEQRLRDEVSRLEGLRTRLASDVEGMARHLEEQRTRIRASLTEALKWIDERVQPADSLVSARPSGGDSGRPAADDHPRGEGPRPRQEGNGGTHGPRPGAVPERKPAPTPSEPPRAHNSDRPQTPVGARARGLGPSTPDLFEGGRRSE